MSVAVLTVFTVLFAWLFNRWRIRAYVKLAFQVPSNRLHTWMGWGPVLKSKDCQSYIFNYAEKYGSESVFWSGPFSVFLLSKPETLEDILTSKNCTHKPAILYDGLQIALGEGLVTISEPNWSRRRKVFNKAFSNTNLTSVTPIFREEVINTLNSMEKNLELGESLDMHLMFQTLTVRTSCKTIFKRNFDRSGYKDTEIAHRFSSFQAYIAEILPNLILKIKFVRYLAELTIYRESKKAIEFFEKFCRESISKNDSSYLANIVSPVDVGFTATHQNILTLNEAYDDLKHLYAGAFETTSLTLFLVICMLAMHHECQERVYEEILSLWPDISDYDKVTFDQVNQLVYLDMVINETMRIFPLIPLVFRTVTNTHLKLHHGLVLPVGQIVCIDIYRLHHNKNIWGPNADRFNPENFSAAKVEQRHPYAFIPFTKGVRVCIGYRYALLFLKICLAELIKKFKFNTDFKYEDLKVRNRASLHLEENPKIKVERRMPQTCRRNEYN